MFIALTCIVDLVQNALYQTQFLSHTNSWEKFSSATSYLGTSRAIIAVLVLLLSLSIQRRPNVFREGTLVDGQFSASFLSRYSFQWSYSLLGFARLKGRLDLEDLPFLHSSSCSESLRHHFQSVLINYDLPLWKTIFVAHWSTFLQQYTLSMLQSVTQVAPQLAMYSLLKILEARRPHVSAGAAGFLRAIALGSSIIVSAWIETQSLWMMWSRLVIPIRSELSALIFIKAMRRKDVKGLPTDSSVFTGMSNSRRGSVSGQLSDHDSEISDLYKDSSQQLRLSTINLVGVDTKRITDFVSASHLIPSSILKLIVSIAFLYTLIGWESVLAGLAVFLIVTPLNVYFSTLMNRVQSRIMRTRDEKMALIEEALQGIRQIKFVASEQQWLEQIRRKRNEELRWQWQSFLLRTVLVGIWALGPIMISAVALTVYTCLQGSLSPSVAFTAIAVLGQIEGSLATIPKLIMQMLEAAISATRIERYFEEQEVTRYTKLANTVSFADASIAWPANLSNAAFGFTLRELSLSFPTNELSIISGKTGSGKSLLLAAIIGEAASLSGVIRIPKPGPERYHNNTHLQTWIIPEAIAFVAQVPWIENATIKDNILFGLLCDEGRYTTTLSVCALIQDLNILPDGDLTEVGVGGINLSGGQKSRISLARAIYSRAGILILDDIFSSVDAHVGLHLFEHALCGELGKGRTRILVTHHTDLCISRASYHVELGNGRTFRKWPGDQGAQANSSHFHTHGAGSAAMEPHRLCKDPEDQKWKALNIPQTTLQLEERSAKPHDTVYSTVEIQRKTDATKGKKFVEDEERENGSVKFGTYKGYLEAAGGVWILIIVVIAHVGYMASITSRVSPSRSRSLKFISLVESFFIRRPSILAYLAITVSTFLANVK